ncbi:uncharacterized protein BO72DRAFT_21762 [Aspergillus fijiensis CBS 313.89]|uniref:Uncharacterized protein n=1 Tax=Aspergillus fijiensis CBS 313.89 TaxID=1448319 RepID=A0A8G1RVS7_9EURO|nr:uncharacterized protein BO72DRAFT_21762 [Aspergillus fijiensis CBS 313.89]RAK79814.1 hypothetical protein BO72DRAFT_21762 [Aspergillus fijiensis CBS 313.89]
MTPCHSRSGESIPANTMLSSKGHAQLSFSLSSFLSLLVFLSLSRTALLVSASACFRVLHILHLASSCELWANQKRLSRLDSTGLTRVHLLSVQ